MAGMSDYLEKKVLEHVLKNTAYTSPTTVYLALFTSDPTDAATGTEVSGGAYARQAVTFGLATLGTGAIATTSDITYPVATANWGTISHIGIYDALTAGNLLFSGALTTSKTITTSDQFKVVAGDLTITLD